MELKQIAYILTDFDEKFGIPRQSGRVPELIGRIVFLPEYAVKEAVRGIEDFTHLWLIFDFDKAHRDTFTPTVRPPRLGGNKRVGVFASRSPFRPNPIGLSCVKLEKIEKEGNQVKLIVSGADLLDGTPVLDIKPYIPYADAKPNAIGGYADEKKDYQLQVEFPSEWLDKIPTQKRDGLLECLADDPRPSYQDDPDRIYGMAFDIFQIKFQVKNGVLKVQSVEESEK